MSINRPTVFRHFVGIMTVCMAGAVAWPALAQAGEPLLASEYDIIGVDDVEVGMKGYGLTVFHGTRVEPFAVEVASVVHGAGPQRSLIWIRSDDERLEVSGPTQGMSGSPIFLWDADEQDQYEIGEGGRLAGAFAYGHSDVLELLAGVQPIEYMRDTGTRAQLRDADAQAGDRRGAGMAGKQTLGRMQAIAFEHGVSESHQVNLRAAQAIFDAHEGIEITADPQRWARLAQSNAEHQNGSAAGPMHLPLSMNNPEIAEFMRPLFEPMGLSPVAGPGLNSGRPPRGMDVENVQFGAGTVLAVPMVFGDLNMAGTGTVTEVLDDGTVLAFGHAMNGIGQTKLPVATGWAHFFVPRSSISFRQAGALEVAGTMVRDEDAAIAARGGEVSFDVAPVNVTVTMEGEEVGSYSYEIVDDEQLTPSLITTVTAESIQARHGFPRESTLRLKGTLVFSDGYELEIDNMVAPGGMFGLMDEVMTPVGMAMQNPHEGLQLLEANIDAEVVDGIFAASIVNARLDRGEVEPGDEVGVTVWVRPYNESVQQFRTSVTIPRDTPEGNYSLTVSGVNGYLSQLIAAKPHLFETDSVGDVMEMMQLIMKQPRDGIYATMLLDEEGIAVGRSELPRMPSSRRALVDSPTSTASSSYVRMISEQFQTGLDISGNRTLSVRVRRD